MPLGNPVTEIDVNALVVPFQYDSVSPFIIVPLKAGDIVDKIELTIEQVFDDPAATLKVGTAANLEKFLKTSDIAVTKLNTHINEENIRSAINETMILTIAPGASTQGSGVVIYTIRR